jgi:hypothetical protein
VFALFNILLFFTEAGDAHYKVLSLDGSCQEDIVIFFIFFQLGYTWCKTQQRNTSWISRYSVAAFNVLRQMLNRIKVDQDEGPKTCPSYRRPLDLFGSGSSGLWTGPYVINEGACNLTFKSNRLFERFEPFFGSHVIRVQCQYFLKGLFGLSSLAIIDVSLGQ